MNDWINQNGNLFSFLGLIITFITFMGVFRTKWILLKINKKNYKINRMPDNYTDLKLISEKLSDYLADFANKKKDIKVELSKISPILKSLSKSLNSDEKEFLKSLKNSIAGIDNWKYEGEKISRFKELIFKEREMTEQLITEVDIKLTRLITDIDNIDKDNKKNLL